MIDNTTCLPLKILFKKEDQEIFMKVLYFNFDNEFTRNEKLCYLNTQN